MGSIVSLFTESPATPEPEMPRLPPPTTEDEPETADNRRKRAEERRRALAMAADGPGSTVKTTPLGATARPELATSGLTAADFASTAAALPRKATLG